MIRYICWAAVVGALIAAGGVYAAISSPWRNSVAAWLAPPERIAEAKLTPEEWTICTTMGAMGSEADWAQLDPDFAAGKKALVAEDWNGAITALKLAALRDPRNADIQNYIGYAYRRMRQLGPAMQHYRLYCSIAATAAPTNTWANSIWRSGSPPKRRSSLRHWKIFA
jgi:hypothetical protein